MNKKISDPPKKKDAAGLPMFTWRGTFELQVSATWVADGFDLTQERLQECLERGFDLGFAREDEVKAKGTITLAPPAEHVKICQGYMSAPDTRPWKKIREME